MLFLAQEDPEKDVQLYINSPADRSLPAWHLRHHAVHQKRCHDIVRWSGASMAAILLAAGSPRSATRSRIRES